MSGYRTMFQDEDNDWTSIYGVSHVVNQRDADLAAKVTPLTPVAKPIPSQFNRSAPPTTPSWTAAFSRIPVSLHTVNDQSVYGPRSNDFASLRYYGNGPY
jgi:hypothetical protein